MNVSFLRPNDLMKFQRKPPQMLLNLRNLITLCEILDTADIMLVDVRTFTGGSCNFAHTQLPAV